MKMWSLLVGWFFILSLSALAKGPNAKVVLVAIDGVRSLEIAGLAKDDFGHNVPAKSLFPNLFQLKRQGIFYPNMRISNPAGISLPAYADVFAGRRQEKIINNHPPPADFVSHYPTIFQSVKVQKVLDANGVGIFSSWKHLCPIATTRDAGPAGEFFKSCGWEAGKYFKPEVFDGSRTDMDTFVELLRELPKRHPSLAFVHFGDADEEAHLHRTVEESAGVAYGIRNYHKALQETDYYIGRLWNALQQDPFYKDSTYLIVFTDHGRDNFPDASQWADHGSCRQYTGGKLCSGCPHAFALVVGPGIMEAKVNRWVSHADIAPTIARLMLVELPTASGEPLSEVAP